MRNSMFGWLCTLCCKGGMVLSEETGYLVCTHHEVLPDGTLALCGHSLRDTAGIRMLLAANALAHKGKLPAFATQPSEKKPEIEGRWTLFVGTKEYQVRSIRKPRRRDTFRLNGLTKNALCPLPFGQRGGVR